MQVYLLIKSGMERMIRVRKIKKIRWKIKKIDPFKRIEKKKYKMFLKRHHCWVYKIHILTSLIFLAHFSNTLLKSQINLMFRIKPKAFSVFPYLDRNQVWEDLLIAISFPTILTNTTKGAKGLRLRLKIIKVR